MERGLTERRLASAVLLQAVKDWQDERNRAEIREFLASDGFYLWAEILDIEPASIRGKLETGNYQQGSIRAVYR